MLERVKRIIGKYTEVADITPESALAADLGLSSFDLVAIIAEFEDEFEIEVPDRDVMSFVTVQDILNYLEKKA